MSTAYEKTPRTTLGRMPKRGVFDREAVNAILDEGFLCHVGFVVDGQPFVIPTGYVRIGDRLCIHGSAASRMLRSLDKGVDVCVTVTLLDGFVMARSAFHHSMNYRSVVVLGKATLVTDPSEKNEILEKFTNHIHPGRWDVVRWPTDQELKGTSVLSIPLDEVSAKVRKGGPVDDEEDYAMDVWAGVIPVKMTQGEPIPDTNTAPPKS